MAQVRSKLTPETSAEWLASCGLLFPTTEKELDCFNAALGEIDPQITGKEVDPFKILREAKLTAKGFKTGEISPLSPYQMVAGKSSDENSLSDETDSGQKHE